jgi:hypothetical protein
MKNKSFILTFLILMIVIPTAQSCILKSPTNIFSVAKGTSVTINWTKNACANAYKIMYRPVGGTFWKYSTNPDTTSKTLYSLLYNTNYEYAIASLDTTTISTYSAIKYFTTLCQCDTSIVVVDSIGINGVKFFWINDTCGIRYKVQYRKLGNSLWTTRVATKLTDNIIATNLLANTTYKWRYRKECNSTGTYASVWSYTWEFVTATPLIEPRMERIVEIDNLIIYYYTDGTIKKEIKVNTFK